MTDNLNSQPLIPGMGFLQVSFGLGADDGTVLDPPPVFIPDEPVLEDGVEGVAQAADAPKIGGIEIIASDVLELPKVPVGTIKRPAPKISGITIKKKS